MSTPHCCPVCFGRGNVRAGFYNPHPTSTGTNAAPEACRTCKGTGVLWGQGAAPVLSPYSQPTTVPPNGNNNVLTVKATPGYPVRYYDTNGRLIQTTYTGDGGGK